MFAVFNPITYLCHRDKQYITQPLQKKTSTMALKYVLRKNNIRSNKAYGKWYAHTVRDQDEMTMGEIEKKIESRCTLTRADVRAVISALQNVVKEGLQDGRVVNLDEMGKLHLSIRSKSVDSPDEFDLNKHITGVVCKYTPQGHRIGMGDRRIKREFTTGLTISPVELVDETGKAVKHERRSIKI